ncbi:hypothetical protein SAMN02746089_00643 [Caldanaerobius fijiensis DSM 17918]|uniref:DUF4830 domain-containing protein n=1 Tax=Caldanaerobius fijiensis DSM 17918 TaxID=1121256 RepID=A0A1M4VJ98_9THEO|nr:hypothetical protein [Caldanaerobius fijiensis]SHE69081.1 hypothetical protein SAMN02746089_00643 [Caldanaerobius fijiensis DSM 17918]
MKKLVYLYLTILILVFLFVACAGIKNNVRSKQSNDIVTNSVVSINNKLKNAQNYLEKRGYKIVSCEGVVSSYELTKDKFQKLPYAQIWKIQDVDADKYIGKNIETIKFIVKNHPLDKFPGNNKKQTQVYVMMVDNSIIDGYSLPGGRIQSEEVDLHI